MRIFVCFWIFCLFPLYATLAESLVVVPVLRDAGAGIYGDVVSRARNPYGLAHGAATQVHEDTHEINSNVRNREGYGGTGKVNAFYLRAGQAVVLAEPLPLSLNDIASTLPVVLRSVRYRAHLLTPQQGGSVGGGSYEGWTEPLYVFDEWSAYLNGGYCHLATGDGDGNTMVQAMEFFGYSLHLLILVEEYKQFNPAWQYDVVGMRRVVKYQAERTSRLFAAMRKNGSTGVDRADPWLYNLQESEGLGIMRAWMLQIYGKAWCRRFWVVPGV